MAVDTRVGQTIKHHDEEYKVIGTRPIRHDGLEKVTGEARYGSDINLPGQLHGKVLRSPHAHARIVSIDASRAAALDGVRAVITSADLPDPGDKLTTGGEAPGLPVKFKSANMLARGKVHYHGHAVAAVAATNPHIADEALKLIDVEYEVLDPVLEVWDAMKPDAPVIIEDLYTAKADGSTGDEPSNVAAEMLYEVGDVDAGFAEADLVVDREFTFGVVHQGYIETHNATANWLKDGHLHVWCSSQGAFTIRQELADLLNHPITKIHVTPMEIGGGFGGKTTAYLEPLAALLSQQTGHPIKMAMDRADVLKATGPTPGGYVRVKLGVTNDGMITAGYANLAFDAGGYPGSVVGAGCRCVFAPYNMPSAKVEGFDVVVNKPKTHAYRAPGATHAEFASETVVDEICRTLDIDPGRVPPQEQRQGRRLAACPAALSAHRPHRVRGSRPRLRPVADPAGNRPGQEARSRHRLRVLVQHRLHLQRDRQAEQRRQRHAARGFNRHRRDPHVHCHAVRRDAGNPR